MPQKTDAVIAELMDRRLLNDVDPDLHQEIAKAVVKAVHTASLEGDAVERVARIIDPVTFAKYDAELVKDRRAENGRRWAEVCHGEAINRALTKARAILTTGLVPDEAAIRADEREKHLDRACESLLVFADGYRKEIDGGAIGIALSNAAFLVFGKERVRRIAAAIRSGGGE